MDGSGNPSLLDVIGRSYGVYRHVNRVFRYGGGTTDFHADPQIKMEYEAFRATKNHLCELYYLSGKAVNQQPFKAFAAFCRRPGSSKPRASDTNNLAGALLRVIYRQHGFFRDKHKYKRSRLFEHLVYWHNFIPRNPFVNHNMPPGLTRTLPPRSTPSPSLARMCDTALKG